MKTSFLFLICIGMMCCVSCRNKGNALHTDPTRGNAANLSALFFKEFYAYYKSWAHSDELFRFFFFDIDGDGVEEAFVALNAGANEHGCRSIFR